MQSRGVLLYALVLQGFLGGFVACNTDDSTNAASDGSLSGSDASNSDGSGDATNSSDGQSTGDGSTPISDGGTKADAMTLPDGGVCTPRAGGGFPCGPTACTNSTTQYCIYGPVPNTCEAVPVECQCEETFTCECLTDNLICDDGGAKGACGPHDDAGAIENADASNVNYFWLIAHTCHPR